MKLKNLYPFRITILCLFVFFSNTVFSQENPVQKGSQNPWKNFVNDISGTIIDAKTKKPLKWVGVEVYIDSVKYAGRYALEDGTFDFKGTHITHGVLRVRKEGYVIQYIPMSLTQNGPYHIELQPESKEIKK